MVRPAAAPRGSTLHALGLALALSLAAAACAPTGSTPADPSTAAALSASPQPPSEPPGAAPSDSPEPAPRPAPQPTSTQPFAADTGPDRAAASGGPVGYLTDIRMGAHVGYDRVVFEYSGPGTPGWHVRYVSSTIAEPAGSPYLVRGEAFLEATLLGVEQPPAGAADAFDGPFIMSISGTRSVVEVIQSSVFEGQMQAFVGVSPQELPFRSFRLFNPSRVVIDVLHAP